jgi:hypothetical protein
MCPTMFSLPSEYTAWVERFMVSQLMYALLTLFCVSLNPGDVADYTRPIVMGEQLDLTLLTRTKQALIDTTFACHKHYFLLV